MGAEDDGGTIRDLIEFFDEYRAFLSQVADHVTVVHDFMANVDGGRKYLQRTLDDLDSAIYTGTEATRVSEINIHRAVILFQLAHC